MNKISLLTFGALCSLTMQGQNYISFHGSTRTNSEEITNTIPQRVNSNSSTSVTITYNIPGANITNIARGNTIYALLKVDGFGQIGEIGSPSLPGYVDIIAMPSSVKDLNVEIVDAQYVDYNNFVIYPVQEPDVDIDTPVEKAFRLNQQAYTSNSFYPSSVAQIVNLQDYRDIPLVYVQVVPVQYNPVTHVTRCYSQITYKLTFGNTEVLNTKLNTSDTNMLKNVITNCDQAARYNTCLESKESYVIITTNKFLEEVKRFAKWKDKTGFKTKILSRSSWNADQVKDSVYSVYQRIDPHPEYLLIVGDDEDVPGKHYTKYYNKTTYTYSTDLYYVCMGGNSDYVPDMAKGRISASTAAEAKVIFDKIMNYQQSPPTNNNFYARGTNCAYFQDRADSNDNLDGYAARRFLQTSEEIRDYMLAQDYSVNRIYCTESGANPRYYNKGTYGNGEPLPAELLKPTFAWNGNSNNIIQEINNGCFYVFHRDHGGVDLWGSPRFTQTDILRLQNNNKLPVVFSMNCLTGSFSDYCFAETFMRHQTGGAVGVFAASCLSYSGYNDALSIGMFDAIWSNPGLTVRFGSGGIFNPNLNEHEDIYPLGKVLNQGLMRMSQTWGVGRYTNELFHYFGDPSMEMYTSIPKSFTNISVIQSGDTIIVNTGGIQGCKVTVCGQNGNYFSSKEGISLLFTGVEEPCSICVTKHNYIPYFFNKDIYVQNKKLQGKNVLVGNNIYIGNSVSPNTPSGDVVIDSGADVRIKGNTKVVLDKGFECKKGAVLKINE